MTNHNTLDDLVRVATMHMSRCDMCNRFALWSMRNRLKCDAHRVDGSVEHVAAPAIRRLIAAGVLK
jgi:hypothetical protein